MLRDDDVRTPSSAWSVLKGIPARPVTTECGIWNSRYRGSDQIAISICGTDWGKRAKLKPRISDMDGGYKLQVIGGELNTCIGI